LARANGGSISVSEKGSVFVSVEARAMRE